MVSGTGTGSGEADGGQRRGLPRLRVLRRRRLLSQRELASLAHVSQNTIHRLEHGLSVAQGRTIRKLAAALKVAPDELLGR